MSFTQMSGSFLIFQNTFFLPRPHKASELHNNWIKNMMRSRNRNKNEEEEEEEEEHRQFREGYLSQSSWLSISEPPSLSPQVVHTLLTPCLSSHSTRMLPASLSSASLMCSKWYCTNFYPNSWCPRFQIPVTGVTHGSYILEVKFSELLRVIQKYNSYTRILQKEIGGYLPGRGDSKGKWGKMYA